MPVAEVILWGELAPFLVMKEAEAVEALAEYVVFQERPKDARVTWLKEVINAALRFCRDPSRTAMAVGGLINQVAWGALLEPDTLKVIEDAVEKLQQGSESQNTSKKNEEAFIRAMWRGKSTEVLQPGLKGKAWIEGAQYCFQPDDGDGSVTCQREDILSDGPPPVRKPREEQKGEPQKRVITAEQLGTGLLVATLQVAKDFFQKFEDTGLVAQLSSQQQVRLGLEILLFELNCKTLSLARFYGEAGYNAASVLARETLTAFAENLQIANVSSFTATALLQLDSHYQYYTEDIWDLWNAENKEDFYKKSGMPGIGGIGDKILRRILNPVLGISLEQPKITREAGEDFEEVQRKAKDAYKEWEKVPDMLILSQLCFIHAVLSPATVKTIAEEFILG